MKYEKSLSFETILDALIKVIPGTMPTEFDSTWLIDIDRKRKIRQRDAFQARLIAIYQQQDELKEDIKHWQNMYNICDDLFWEQYTQIQAQINELRSACEELIQNLVALDDRLYSILKPSVPVEGTVYAEDEATVPLANVLMVITRTVKDAIGRVDSILHRCEL